MLTRRIAAVAFAACVGLSANADPLGDIASAMGPGEMKYIALPAPQGSVVEDTSWKSNRTVWTAENGGAFNGRHLWMHGGGHNDGAHNGVWLLDTYMLAWSRPFLNQPLALAPILPPVGSGCMRPTAGPEATHTYNAFEFVDGFGDPLLDGSALLFTIYASTSNASPSPPCNYSGEGVKSWWAYNTETATWTELASNATEAAGTSAIADWRWQKQVAWAQTPDGIEVYGDKLWCALKPAPLRFENCQPQNKAPWYARYVTGVGLVVVTSTAVEVYDGRTLLRTFPIPATGDGVQGTRAEAQGNAGMDPIGTELSWWPGGAVVRYLDLLTGAWRIETGTGPLLPDITSSTTMKATHTDQTPLSKWRWLQAKGVFLSVPTPDGVWLYKPVRPGPHPPSVGVTLPCGESPAMEVSQDGTTIVGIPGCQGGQEPTLAGVDPGGFGVVRVRPGVRDTSLAGVRLRLEPKPVADNRAAIRAQGHGLRLDHVEAVGVYGDGILNGEDCGDVVILDSKFNGAGGGRNEGHGIYHCSADEEDSGGSLRVERSQFLDCRKNTGSFGEAIKSRGGIFLLDHVAAGAISVDSRCDKGFSAPHGGTGIVSSSVFFQGPASGSDVVIGYGHEARCKDWTRKWKSKNGPDLCIADGAPAPEGYYPKHEYENGPLFVMDSAVVCDRYKVLRGEIDWTKPTPCRVENRSNQDLKFINTTFVRVRGALADGVVTNPRGGRIIFERCRVCESRTACGLPQWTGDVAAFDERDYLPL